MARMKLRCLIPLVLAAAPLTASPLAVGAAFPPIYGSPKGEPASTPMRQPAPPFLELGPMLGHTGSTNAGIWVKASRPAKFAVRVGREPDLSDAQVYRGPRLVSESACMGHVEVSGLKPAQRYSYCVLLDGRPAMLPPYPSFVTAPPEGRPGHVRFAFISCVGYNHYDSAAGWADMVRTNFDLILFLGDNHYGNSPLPEKQRAAYYDQRRTAGYREITRSTPGYAIWDDHDFGPDNSDGALKGKEQALQCFKEHWANPAYGEPDNPGVYFKFAWGDVDFFMLDGRYHRSPNKSTNTAAKTMLGAAQLAWLKRELTASRAPIKVLAAGGEWQSHGTDDSWTSFKRERDELFGFIEEQQIPGVLLVSGDRHFTAAYQVKGKWIEVTSGPLGSKFADSKPTPEMFYHAGQGHFYCIFDLDTGRAPPAVTLEVYRVGDGLIERRAFSWDEFTGRTKIPSLPAAPKAESAKPAGTVKPKS